MTNTDDSFRSTSRAAMLKKFAMRIRGCQLFPKKWDQRAELRLLRSIVTPMAADHKISPEGSGTDVNQSPSVIWAREPLSNINLSTLA